MRFVPILLALALVVPALAVAAPEEGKTTGVERACERSGNANPCRLARVIPDTTVAAGETRTYEDGEYQAQGTIVVEAGGSVVVDNATLTFGPDSAGILVETGGTLRVLGSVLREGASGSAFRLDLAPASDFTLNLSRVTGGEGVRLATELANVSGNLLEEIPLALHLLDVSVVVHHNRFVNNTVAVNQTGGAPTLSHNRFEGGLTCVRDWLSDPTIVHNVFRGCIVGIYHHRSESTLSANDLEDKSDPGGVGILVEDTMSPVISDNLIRHYGTGILIVNARAYIRNNTIADNLLDGIRIVNNSAPMDIQGNLVHSNGRHGVVLESAHSIPVFGNVVRGNNGTGILVSGSTGITVDDNLVSAHQSGIVVGGTPAVVVSRNRVFDGETFGIHVAADAADATVVGNEVAGSLVGIQLDGARASLRDTQAYGNVDGVLVRSDGAQLFNVTAFNNTGQGIAVHDADNVTASALASTGNGADGLQVRRSWGAFTAVDVTDNGRHGVWFDAADNVPVTPFDHVTSLRNGGAGFLNSRGNATVVHMSWFAANLGPGAQNDDNSTMIDMRFNYWGSALGPTHPDNPEGNGDEIVGRIDYEPYLTGPPGSFHAIG